MKKHLDNIAILIGWTNKLKTADMKEKSDVFIHPSMVFLFFFLCIATFFKLKMFINSFAFWCSSKFLSSAFPFISLSCWQPLEEKQEKNIQKVDFMKINFYSSIFSSLRWKTNKKKKKKVESFSFNWCKASIVCRLISWLVESSFLSLAKTFALTLINCMSLFGLLPFLKTDSRRRDGGK